MFSKYALALLKIRVTVYFAVGGERAKRDRALLGQFEILPRKKEKERVNLFRCLHRNSAVIGTHFSALSPPRNGWKENERNQVKRVKPWSNQDLFERIWRLSYINLTLTPACLQRWKIPGLGTSNFQAGVRLDKLPSFPHRSTRWSQRLGGRRVFVVGRRFVGADKLLGNTLPLKSQKAPCRFVKRNQVFIVHQLMAKKF